MAHGKYDAPTICWKCWNAVPDKNGRGCAWSRNLEPVEGWTAEKTVCTNQSGSGGKAYLSTVQSYLVRECPEFIRG